MCSQCSQMNAEGSIVPPANSRTGGGEENVTRKHRWLLFLRHCAKCDKSEQECPLKAQCNFGKQLWQHILHCDVRHACKFPHCSNSKELLKHHAKCLDTQCPVCEPVKEYVRKLRAADGGR